MESAAGSGTGATGATGATGSVGTDEPMRTARQSRG
jgi:hypothetical protein